MDLNAMINNLTAFDFQKEQEEIITDNKDKLADLQAQQFAQGIDAEGQPIELIDNPQCNFGYRPYTIFKKQKEGIGLGRITDRITFYNTGELYREMNVTIANSTFEITSKVPYWSTLMARTQTQTELLSEDSRRQFAEGIVLPGIEQALKDKVFS